MSEELTEIYQNKSPLLPPPLPAGAPPPLSECNGANFPHNSTIRITHAAASTILALHKSLTQQTATAQI